jgi:hypothetical protein
MTTYSLLNVKASISGPGGSFSIGSDAGVGEEGITVDLAEDKNTMTIGGGGAGMHSLHASKAGMVTIRLLKTSPTNKLLNALYNFQAQSSTNWGQNLITIQDMARGDNITAADCAFKKQAPVAFAKDGNVMEWVFDSIAIDEQLGSGSPSL